MLVDEVVDVLTEIRDQIALTRKICEEDMRSKGFGKDEFVMIEQYLRNEDNNQWVCQILACPCVPVIGLSANYPPHVTVN